MEFIETTKGGRKLSKDGFLYIKNKTLANGRTYWECTQRRSGNGCNVKIALDAADRFVAQTHQHTHAADCIGKNLLKAKAGIKGSAKDTTVAFFCLAQMKVFVSFAIHRAGFWTEHLNQAQFNLCNCTSSMVNKPSNIVGAHAPLPNKRRATYIEMLTEVQWLTHNAMPHSLMTDFESSILIALNQIYRSIPQVGCLFHLAKNVSRRVQDIRLQQNYLTDLLFRGNISMIPAFSFLPVQDVMLEFGIVACGIDEQPVLDYFETNYISELRRG